MGSQMMKYSSNAISSRTLIAHKKNHINGTKTMSLGNSDL
jgi:hypothetical protein